MWCRIRAFLCKCLTDYRGWLSSLKSDYCPKLLIEELPFPLWHKRSSIFSFENFFPGEKFLSPLFRLQNFSPRKKILGGENGRLFMPKWKRKFFNDRFNGRLRFHDLYHSPWTPLRIGNQSTASERRNPNWHRYKAHFPNLGATVPHTLQPFAIHLCAPLQ
jgi:hypothetical protein